MANVFITGTSRGIGHGLARKFLAAGDTVFCAARNPDGARDLWELERDFGPRCRIVHLDVTSDADLQRLEGALAGAPIDILVNNAGVLPERDASFEKTVPETMLKAFTVNTIAPMRVTQALLPNLRRAKAPLVVTISSKVGSIADNSSGGMIGYRTSKTAMNMVNKCMAVELTDVTCVVMHPGWVETAMGGPNAPTSLEDSTRGLHKVITGLTHQDTGKFYDFRGEELPW